MHPLSSPETTRLLPLARVRQQTAILRARLLVIRSESLSRAQSFVLERLNLAHSEGTVWMTRPISMVSMTIVVVTVVDYILSWNICLLFEDSRPVKSPTRAFLL